MASEISQSLSMRRSDVDEGSGDNAMESQRVSSQEGQYYHHMQTTNHPSNYNNGVLNNADMHNGSRSSLGNLSPLIAMLPNSNPRPSSLLHNPDPNFITFRPQLPLVEPVTGTVSKDEIQKTFRPYRFYVAPDAIEREGESSSVEAANESVVSGPRSTVAEGSNRLMMDRVENVNHSTYNIHIKTSDHNNITVRQPNINVETNSPQTVWADGNRLERLPSLDGNFPHSTPIASAASPLDSPSSLHRAYVDRDPKNAALNYFGYAASAAYAMVASRLRGRERGTLTESEDEEGDERKE
eukprot:CAMPEP_0175043070 /NCGR_PEP_ID=MMETSP0052_2-20121109/2955_1 /TAXON_ID=51329 ORGANISM="Polytomella parva, Strain SAG 63-3" /NCGR_SAMPLE_ID=MMETSP0052_2 /ASSEMBLY_ACC=CAM_ASM_000194 /LENGTH=296 /DNA_ID=CAMNT_0016306033 /DNA_START=838 /DNA_END=1728 /DNA_ORIENTATION=+